MENCALKIWLNPTRLTFLYLILVSLNNMEDFGGYDRIVKIK
jgi:hypothetical protein